MKTVMLMTVALLLATEVGGALTGASISCVRTGNNLKLLAPLDSATVQQTAANEDKATMLKKVQSSGLQSSSSIWLYIGESVDCTITTTGTPTSGNVQYSIAVTSYDLRKWITSPNTGVSQMTILAKSNWLATIKDESGKEHQTAVGASLVTGSKFSIIYPCAELEILRSKLTLALRATVVDGADTLTATQDVVAQYFYGYPDSISLTCPTDVDKVHAWSSTDANPQSTTAKPYGPTGATIYQAEMLYCRIISTDADGENMIPDPLYSTNGLQGTFTVDLITELCPSTGCRIDPGRPPQTGLTLADIPFISNVIRDSQMPYTQVAWEPKDFARVLVSVSLVDKRAFPAQTATVNIGGPLTSETTATCVSNTLDLSTPDVPITCTIVPMANGAPTAAFTDDLYISDTSGGASTTGLSDFLTMKPLVKGASAAYKSWNSPSAPGFSFTLELLAKSQPSDFDGKTITLYVHWRKKSLTTTDFPYTTCKRTLATTEDLILFTNTIRVTIAYVPKPVISLSCNDKLCSDTVPAVISYNHVGTTVTQNPLTIIPYVSGSGTSTKAFGEGSVSSCWTRDLQTTCFESTTETWRTTSTRGVLIVSGEPETPVNPDGYTFQVKLSFSFLIMETALRSEVTATVKIFFNGFEGIGSTKVTDSVLSTVGSLPIYCQGFVDADEPFTAWLTSTMVDETGAPLPGEEDKIATTTYENFELKSLATASQLTEISFSHSFGGDKNTLKMISTATAIVTQKGSKNPLSGSGSPSNALDGNTDTEWIDYNMQPIIISFQKPVVMDQFTMTTGLSNPENDIMQWELSGSYDGSTWDVLHSQSNNYPVPLDRKTVLPWFPLNVWKVHQAGGVCTNCRIIIPDAQTTITSEVECKWLCGRSKQCNYINFESVAKTCEILSCDTTPITLTADTTQCSSLAMEFRYLQFKPIRMRETPIQFWPVVSGNVSANTHHKVTCHVQDAKGSVATASDSVIVTAAPLVPPLPTITAVADADVYLRLGGMQYSESLGTLTLDEIDAQVATVQLLITASGSSRLNFADYCLSIIEGRVTAAVAKDGIPAQSPRQLERIIEIVKTLAELINVNIGYQDPTVSLTTRAGANTRITTILELSTSITNSLVLTTKSLGAASSVISLLLDGIEHESAIPVSAVNSRGPATLATVDTAKTRVDFIMKIACNLGTASLHGKELDSCTTCDTCATSGGLSINACIGTAFGIRGKTASPTTSVSGTFPLEYPSGQTPPATQLIQSTAGRVPLSWHVGFIGFSLPKNPRLYDSDFILLRGNVSNFCLVHYAQEHRLRSLIAVDSTTMMQVTAPIVTTNTAKQPLIMSRRDATSWSTAPCVSTVPVVGSTSITQFCGGMTDGLPSEYAAVSEIMYARCTPGDITGCIAVTNEKKTFEDCTCTICSSAATTAAPNGYFRDPVANGKFCVPFESFTCDTVRSTYTAVISDQCKGGSVLVGGACVCDVHKTCASGFCQGEGRCGQIGGRAECAASNLLFNDTTLMCECAATHYCEFNALVPTCVENLDCSINRETEYDAACTGGSVRDPETKKCTCGNTEYCHPSSKQCTSRSKCGGIPYQSEANSTYCWPAELGQPKLVAADNYVPIGDYYGGTINPLQVYCQCPNQVACDLNIYEGTCTCPLCLNGGQCLYTTDKREWVALNHSCYCPEGFTGSDCGIVEEKKSYFVFVTYPDGDFEAYSAMTDAQKQLVIDSVNATAVSQAATQTVSNQDVLAVVIEAGSIIFRVELRVYPSSWDRAVAWNLQQTEFFNQLAANIQASLGDELFALLVLDGSLAFVSQVESTCDPIDNCLASGSQWGPIPCQCLACVDGYFVNDGKCQEVLSCENYENCNGRGVASLNDDKTVCLCECTTEFTGRQCEIDICFESLETWTTNLNCGPLRCSQRIDDRRYPGPYIGSCITDADPELSNKDIVAMVVLLTFCALCTFFCAYYWIKLECIWDRSTDSIFGKDEEEDEEEEQLRPQEEHSPHVAPDDEPFEGTISVIEGSDDGLGG